MSKLRGILRIIIGVYFTSVFFIAFPYFNWRYARDHGVGSWIAFGEVVATAKSVIWPYYVFRGTSSKAPKQYAESDSHYNNSKVACDKALTIIVRKGGTDKLSSTEQEEIVGFLSIAVDEAGRVEDKYLLAVNRELEKRYKDQYIGGMKAIITGLAAKDRVCTLSGSIKYNEFSKWLAEHAEEMNWP
jgi:hypothetical protein